MQRDRKLATIVHYHRNEKDPLSPSSNIVEWPLVQGRFLKPPPPPITAISAAQLVLKGGSFQSVLPAEEELVHQEKKVWSQEGTLHSLGLLWLASVRCLQSGFLWGCGLELTGRSAFHLPNGESSLSPLERNATVKQVCLRLLMFFGRSTSNWECLTSCWILACCKRYNPSCKKEDTGFQIIFDAVWNQSSTSPNHSSPRSSLTLFHALSFSRYPKLLTAGWRNWNANQSSAVLKFSANWLFFSGCHRHGHLWHPVLLLER